MKRDESTQQEQQTSLDARMCGRASPKLLLFQSQEREGGGHGLNLDVV